MTISVQQLIEHIATRQPVINQDSLSNNILAHTLDAISDLSSATHHSLTFVEQEKYLKQLHSSAAGVVLIKQAHLQELPEGIIALVVQSPYLAYASCSQLFEYTTSHTIHPTAYVDPTACIGNNVSIGAYAIIGANAHIGDQSVIGSHVCIEDCVHIGSHAMINSHATIKHHCQLGSHVRLHAGSVIGSEGFGFAPTNNPAQYGWERIAQLGRVIIGDNVRIGANTTVDRGAINDTIISDNVIIDNLVQVAHNVHIGNGTAIAANTAIAGSAIIGQNCIIGGAVGIVGHLTICDGVTITAMSFITKSITESGSYSSGMPALPSATWRRMVAKMRQLIKK